MHNPLAARRSKCVVVVDDDATTRELLAEVLRFDGYSVDTYACEDALIEGFRTMLAGGRTPDVVVCDIAVPGQCDLAVLPLLRQSGLDLPVVLTSGFISEGFLNDAFACGVSVVLSKPFSIHDLRRVIACLVSGTDSP
jgi:CheY-like chemotaxis protein